MVLWCISSLRDPHISWFLVRNYSAHQSMTELYQPLLLPSTFWVWKSDQNYFVLLGVREGFVPVRVGNLARDIWFFWLLSTPRQKKKRKKGNFFVLPWWKYICSLFTLVHDSQALVYKTLIQGNNYYPLLVTHSPSISGCLERIWN